MVSSVIIGARMAFTTFFLAVIGVILFFFSSLFTLVYYFIMCQFSFFVFRFNIGCRIGSVNWAKKNSLFVARCLSLVCPSSFITLCMLVNENAI